ncbi:hypothetical protein [Methylobacterium nigriterrae]|uniref:hypothetical protein n=1 Tax=Methylobacterium nigriterrae TaxID=3127512 RepID=UPI00301411AB
MLRAVGDPCPPQNRFSWSRSAARIVDTAAIVLARMVRVPLDWIYLGEEAWLPAELRDKLREAAQADANQEAP